MTRIERLNVLIVGAGVAGLTAAYWLRRHGHHVRVIERAAWPRTDGYMIDFYGPGYAVAEEMGILPDLKRFDQKIEHWTFRSADGAPLFSLPYADLRRRIFGGRHLTLLRSDLERILLARVCGEVEIRYGVSLVALGPLGVRMSAKLSDQSSVACDLVIGAGGVHSATRRIWIDAKASCERYLGFDAAAFSIADADLRARLGGGLDTLTGPGRQVTIYPTFGDHVGVRFVHDRGTTLENPSAARVAAELRSAYGGFGGVVPALLSGIETATDLSYDAMTQVTLPRWSLGHVVLVGDACHCASPLGIQGASLAMAGARRLAAEIVTSGDLNRALASYERSMRPAVTRAQEAGRRMACWIAPRSKFKMFARDLAVRASPWPMAATLARRALGAAELPSWRVAV